MRWNPHRILWWQENLNKEVSVMVYTLKRIYKEYQNKSMIANAVKRGWITAEDYNEIVGEEYVV